LAQPLLDELLERLDWSNPQADIVDWDEASQWGPEALSLLLESSVIVPVEPAQSVVCDACYDAHVEEVRFLPSPDDGQFRAFISCPQCGPVAVEPQRLQRWQIRLEGFINLCSLVANDSVPPRVILPGRLIDLGAVKLDDMRVRTLIGRGLAWRDRNALLDRVRGSVGDSEAILLVPSESPTAVTDNIRVVPMLGNLVAGDNGVRVRLPSLRPSNVPIAGASNSLQKLGAGWRVTFRGETRIVKNTLLLRAAAALGITGLDAYLDGPTAVAITRDDPVAPAKALHEFIRQMRKLEVKGALVEGRVMGAAQVKGLAELPGKAQLRARVLGALQAPPYGLVGALSGVPRNLVYALDQIRRQKEAAA